MKSICFIVCSNGLGHFIRTLNVAKELLRISENLELHIYCSQNILKKLNTWEFLTEKKTQDKIKFYNFESFIKWTSNSGYYDDENLLNWDPVFSQLKLKTYSLVVSDNLIEVLKYRTDAVLSGSFFWHDVLEEYFPYNENIFRYAGKCRDLLDKYSPVVIANKYFAMQEVQTQKRYNGVGMLNFNNAKHASLNEVPKVLLMSGSFSTKNMQQLLESYEGLHEFKNTVEIFTDISSDKIKIAARNLKTVELNFSQISEFDTVVARAGMGIITDCIINKKFLFTINSDNKEIKYNEEILEKLKLGMNFYKAGGFKGIAEKLPDKNFISEYYNFNSLINKNGLQETCEILNKLIN